MQLLNANCHGFLGRCGLNVWFLGEMLTSSNTDALKPLFREGSFMNLSSIGIVLCNTSP